MFDVQKVSRRRPTLPDGYPSSTIGAGGLNFRVRDGNGCVPSAIATGKTARLGRARRVNGATEPTRKSENRAGEARKTDPGAGGIEVEQALVSGN